MSPSFLCVVVYFAYSALSTPCHESDCPRDRSLRCSVSADQIVFSQNAVSDEQKTHLIIFEIDEIILEHAYGHHGVIPDFGENSYEIYTDKASGLQLLFLKEPYPVTIIFREHFFELLRFVHANFTADLVIYSRASREYTEQISQRIDEIYQSKYGPLNAGTSSIFRMVICRKTPKTAKTISTLAHKLKLFNYQKIIILDERPHEMWCKHDLIKLRSQQNIAVEFVACSSFDIWRNVYETYWQWYNQEIKVPLANPLSVNVFVMHHSEYFCSCIMQHRAKDTQFKELLNYFVEEGQNKQSKSDINSTKKTRQLFN